MQAVELHGLLAALFATFGSAEIGPGILANSMGIICYKVIFRVRYVEMFLMTYTGNAKGINFFAQKSLNNTAW